MELQWCTQDAWQKGEAGRKCLGVTSEIAEDPRHRTGCNPRTQKPWWVTPQPLGHAATKVFLSLSNPGLSFPELAMSMSILCLFSEVLEMDHHCSISTYYLYSLAV